MIILKSTKLELSDWNFEKVIKLAKRLQWHNTRIFIWFSKSFKLTIQRLERIILKVISVTEKGKKKVQRNLIIISSTISLKLEEYLVKYICSSKTLLKVCDSN